MEKDFEENYHKLESSHWWFLSRRKYVTQLLENVPKDATILDIGCSSGHLLMDMEATGRSKDNLWGIDISPEGIALCQEFCYTNTQVMDAQNISLSTQFDVLIASDCLEHLEQDEKALKNWYSLLKPGGKLLVFVPAFMSLWSGHDVVNMHYRRYTRAELKTKLKAEGFMIKKASYWNFLLFTPVWLIRKLKKEKDLPSGDLSMPPAPVNAALKVLISIENTLLRFLSFPVGVSVFCIAYKPK